MTAPRASRLPALALVTTAVAAAAVLVVSAGPSALAAAERLITGKDVADHSIGSKDLAPDAVRSKTIRKDAVTSRDIRNGTITAEDLDAGLQGVVGPAGPAGANGKDGVDGAPGPAGQAEPDGVATWTIHHEANGDTSVARQSSDTIPAGALIEPLAYTVEGDFSSCTGFIGKSLQFHVMDGTPLLHVFGDSVSASVVQTVRPSPSRLTFTSSCMAADAGSPMGYPAQVPSFDASLTFQWTVRDTTPTQSFN